MSISRQQAEQALAAVTQQFVAFCEPLIIGGRNYGISSLPTLVETSQGDWEIVWEDGPDEWAYRASMGGSSEEDRALAAAASVEFGTTITVPEDKPVTFPRGVHAEPVMSFVLGLYEA